MQRRTEGRGQLNSLHTRPTRKAELELNEKRNKLNQQEKQKTFVIKSCYTQNVALIDFES